MAKRKKSTKGQTMKIKIE